MLTRQPMRLRQRPADAHLNITLPSTRTVQPNIARSSASVLAVSERQALETLSRDEKTAFRALAQEPKTKNCNGNQERLRADKHTQKASVRGTLILSSTYPTYSL
ncbi:hypothetical protein EDD22DRAFT_959720 [Suillus occidentalis]|nr:hypothetical protein EDD22DRAFT_959720 [Suillus occidentalis]